VTENAATIWGNNIRQIREHFQAQVDAACEVWFTSEMSIVQRDINVAAIRSAERHAVEQEKALYYANREKDDG
jgi:hypothetical protein